MPKLQVVTSALCTLHKVFQKKSCKLIPWHAGHAPCGIERKGAVLFQGMKTHHAAGKGRGKSVLGLTSPTSPSQGEEPDAHTDRHKPICFCNAPYCLLQTQLLFIEAWSNQLFNTVYHDFNGGFCSGSTQFDRKVLKCAIPALHIPFAIQIIQHLVYSPLRLRTTGCTTTLSFLDNFFNTRQSAPRFLAP